MTVSFAAAAVMAFAVIAIACVTYFYVIPWFGRLGALYGLHATRDRVFKAGLTYPRARNTLFYRDVDALLAACIHTVREESVREALGFVNAMTAAEKRVDSKSWRVRQLNFELQTAFATDDGRLALEDLRGAARVTESYLMLRVCTGHPAALCLGLICLVVAVPYVLFKKLVTAMRHGVTRVTAPRIEPPKIQVSEVRAVNGLIEDFDSAMPSSRLPAALLRAVASQRHRLAA